MAKYTAGIVPNKYLSKEEQGQLVTLIEKYRYKDLRNTTMLMFMLQTGARPCETLDLTWYDINFEDRSIFINTRKGGHPRVIPIGQNLLSRFKKLGPGKPEDKVFKMVMRNLQHWWYQYRPVKKRVHSLRHTFAYNLYKKTNDILLVQQALGHKHASTTSVYLQIQASTEYFRKALGDITT